LPYFSNYLKDIRADYPGGNVLFPPVKAEEKVKNCPPWLRKNEENLGFYKYVKT